MLHLRDKHKAMTKSLQAGRYKLESEHEDKRSAVDEALASCEDAVHAIVPQMVDELSRTHPPCDVMRNSSGAPTSRGFTNCTLTTNYSCSYHIDREDHNCGAIM
ncbi:hypothetical protein CEUSTIGMA_g10968.t1 [Chlamydomonas eustigma]|uniref:Uncharacterized protein n=1 Tax=Chlamydomonas eustigma TaxID=1157962 RepID=A0A250XKJ4_9CHLO|nr:hypothetical protein CEUSTIGMA_g10968.t1 [Chlamydomonas eustigma]|eukprot:GAX83543.1 hypothetical protein CEUSTIGMA_g10968.t1 [Chlamydomonas eustigma]